MVTLNGCIRLTATWIATVQAGSTAAVLWQHSVFFVLLTVTCSSTAHTVHFYVLVATVVK